jgi:hypothetical protein
MLEYQDGSTYDILEAGFSHKGEEYPATKCHHERPINMREPCDVLARKWRTRSWSCAMPCSTNRCGKPRPPYNELPKTMSREVLRLILMRARVALTGAFWREMSSAAVNDHTANVNTIAGMKHEKYASQTSRVDRPLLKMR